MLFLLKISGKEGKIMINADKKCNRFLYILLQFIFKQTEYLQYFPIAFLMIYNKNGKYDYKQKRHQYATVCESFPIKFFIKFKNRKEKKYFFTSSIFYDFFF